MKFSIKILSISLLVMTMTILPAKAGDLDPPGAPGSPETEMKSLNQVEPRVLIETIPFTITSPGSYYMAQNLYATSSIVGITIQSSDVQIDLNGFALIGTNGSLHGITVLGTNENIAIRNGSIRKWDGFGIKGRDANDGAVVDIKAHRNGLGGILFGEGSMIMRCTAYGNGYNAPLPPAFMPMNVDQDEDNDMLPDHFEQMIIDFSTTDPINTLEDVWPYFDMMFDDPPGHPPIHWDFDHDTINNEMELMDGTDPTDPNDNSMNNYIPEDMDFDGLEDGWEQVLISNDVSGLLNDIYDVWPWYDPMLDQGGGASNVHWDFDGDSYENMQEFQFGTDPMNPGSIPTNTTQGEYAGYTEPEHGELYKPFEDMEDEPSDDGIRVRGFSTVKECKSRKNRGSGIYANYASIVEKCISAGNLVDGIRVTQYATVDGCTSARNKKYGITLVSKCRVVNNNCGQNGQLGSTAGMMPEGAGIRILGSGNRVENNNVSGNTIGILVENIYEAEGSIAGSNLIIGNSAVDNWGGAFDLSTGDFMGGQYFEGDVGDTSGGTNAASMDANNPHTNFRF